MKKKLTVSYEIETDDFQDIMDSDNLTLEEAIDQMMTDGELELNELPITDYKVEENE